jgi:hypothetical protein
MSTALAYGCDSNERMVIDKREVKIASGYVDFRAESSVEKYSTTARKFVWCIGNIHRYHVAAFNWGTVFDEGKYFSGIVEPENEVSSSRTDSSEVRIDGRILQFRRLNTSSWKEIMHETIFYDRLGNIPRNPITLAQLPAPQPDSLSSVDLEKLSEDPSSLNEFVREQQNVIFYSRLDATVPATDSVRHAIETYSYGEYSGRDFADVTIQLTHRMFAPTGASISPSGVNYPWSDVYIAVSGDYRASQALAQVPLRIKITSNDQRARFLPLPVPWMTTVDSRDLRLPVMNVPLERLSYVTMFLSLSAANSDFILASMPIRMLLPVRIGNRAP